MKAGPQSSEGTWLIQNVDALVWDALNMFIQSRHLLPTYVSLGIRCQMFLMGDAGNKFFTYLPLILSRRVWLNATWSELKINTQSNFLNLRVSNSFLTEIFLLNLISFIAGNSLSFVDFILSAIICCEIKIKNIGIQSSW